MYIGQRIKHFRQISGIYAEEVASGLGISIETYRKYESGVCSFPHEHIPKLCDILGITPNTLYGYIGQYAALYGYVLDHWDGDIKALINFLGMYALQPIKLRRDTADLCVFNAEKAIEQGTADFHLVELLDIEHVKKALDKLFDAVPKHK